MRPHNVYSIWAKSSGGCVLGGSANGSRNKHSVAVAEEAAQSVVSSLKMGVCADDHLQDQVRLFAQPVCTAHLYIVLIFR